MAYTTAAALAFSGLSAAQAIAGNSRIDSARRENRRRERITNRSLALQGEREVESLSRDFVRLLGNVRASAAERGVSASTQTALEFEQRSAFDRAASNVAFNTAQTQLETLLAFEQRDSQLAAQRQSPLLAAVQGGIDGARLGLSLDNEITALNASRTRLARLRSETSSVGLVNFNVVNGPGAIL